MDKNTTYFMNCVTGCISDRKDDCDWWFECGDDVAIIKWSSVCNTFREYIRRIH